MALCNVPILFNSCTLFYVTHILQCFRNFNCEIFYIWDMVNYPFYEPKYTYNSTLFNIYIISCAKHSPCHLLYVTYKTYHASFSPSFKHIYTLNVTFLYTCSMPLKHLNTHLTLSPISDFVYRNTEKKKKNFLYLTYLFLPSYPGTYEKKNVGYLYNICST